MLNSKDELQEYLLQGCLHTQLLKIMRWSISTHLARGAAYRKLIEIIKSPCQTLATLAIMLTLVRFTQDDYTFLDDAFNSGTRIIPKLPRQCPISSGLFGN